MTEPTILLQRLRKSLHILEQREAKYGPDTPATLILEIEDHRTAIGLTRQLAAGKLSETAWREQLKPLLVTIEEREATEAVTSLNIGGVNFSDISGSSINVGDIDASVHIHTYDYHYYTQTPPDTDIDPDEDVIIDDLFPPARHVIGRQVEWEQLMTLHKQLRQEKLGRIVFVTGQAGYGRQALARAFVEQARQQGTPILALRFRELRRGARGSETFWHDDPLIGPALEAYGERVKKFWPQACEIGQLSWQALVAQIAQLLEFTPSPGDQNVADQPEALRKLLRFTGRQHQPLLLLENLDDGPGFWLDLLRYLALEIGQELPCLMVITAAAPEPVRQLKLDQADEEYLHLIRTLVKEARAEELWLARIDVGAVGAYLGPAEPAVIEQLHYLTDGIPVLVESLWQEWLEYEAVIQDEQQRWVRNADEWPVYGNIRDFADDLLHGCLTDDAPFSREQVETMLSYAALEGYTFTAQAVARLLNVSDKDLQDFWDDYLLEADDLYGVMINVDAAAIAGTSRYVDLYRFSVPFLRQVWLQYVLRQPDPGRLAETLETVYYPDTNPIKRTLIRLFEAADQSGRADYYRHQHRLDSDIKTLMWQVNLLASLAETPFEQYRLYELRLELSSKLYDTGYGGRLGYEQARLALSLAEAWGDQLRQARAMNLAGLNLRQIADYEAARPYYERALAIVEKVLGPEHPHTAGSLNNLGLLLDSQGDYGGARPYFERALAINEKVLGPEHPATATSLNNLGLLLDSQGDYAGARPYYERALAIVEKVLGPEHPHTATSLNNLGFLLYSQGDYGGARPLYERALAISERALGPEHPQTRSIRRNLSGMEA